MHADNVPNMENIHMYKTNNKNTEKEYGTSRHGLCIQNKFVQTRAGDA